MNMEKNTTKNLIRQGSILVASSLVVRIMGLLYRIPITNLWGDQGLGTYGDAYQVYSFFLVFASFSIPAMMSKMMGERLATGQYANAKKVFRCAMYLVGGIGLVCMLIMWFGCDLIAVKLYNNPDAAQAIRFLGPTILIVSLMSVIRGYFQGMNNMKPTAISEVIEGFLHAVFSVALAFWLFSFGMNWSVTGGILGTGVGAAGGLLFLFFCYRLYQSRSRIGRASVQKATESSRQIYSQMLRLMIPIVLASTIFSLKSMIDASLFGKLMLAKGYDADTVVAMRGIYTGKFVVLINLPISIGDSLGAASVPSVAASLALGRDDELKERLCSVVKTVLIIAVPCAFGLGALGKPILRLLFRSSYMGGELFWVGSFAVVFYCVNHVATGILQGLNKPQIPMRHAFIGVLVTSVLNVLLIGVLDLNIYALPVNTLVFSGMIMVLNMRQAMKLCKVRVNFWKMAKIPVLCGAVMAVLCILSYILLFALAGSNAVATVGAVIAAVISYFVLMVNLGGINQEDMENIPMGRYLRYLKLNKK